MDKKIVGSVTLERISDKEYILVKMGVKSGNQGLRIGQLLMKRAMKKTEELNLSTVVLSTDHQLVQVLNFIANIVSIYENSKPVG